jgi:hypothetical protein
VGGTGWAVGTEGTDETEGADDLDGADCDEGDGHGADTGWDEGERPEAGGGAGDQGGWPAPNL